MLSLGSAAYQLTMTMCVAAGSLHEPCKIIKEQLTSTLSIALLYRQHSKALKQTRNELLVSLIVITSTQEPGFIVSLLSTLIQPQNCTCSCHNEQAANYVEHAKQAVGMSTFYEMTSAEISNKQSMQACNQVYTLLIDLQSDAWNKVFPADTIQLSSFLHVDTAAHVMSRQACLHKCSDTVKVVDPIGLIGP